MKSKTKKIISLVIINIGAILFVVYSRFDEHAVYKEYNNKKYTVASVHATRGKYGSIGPTILSLDNGGTINAGYSEWIKGDTFINEINYSYIFGITCYAYFYAPNKTLMIFRKAFTILIILFYALLIIGYSFSKVMNYLNKDG